MNRPTPEPDRQFATDLDRGAAADSPARCADSLTVHGFLSLLRPGEAAEIDRRVDRAMAEIRAQSRRSGVLGRIDVRRVAGIASLAALVALAIFIIPGTGETRAFATLQSVVKAGRDSSNRVYQLTMERGPTDRTQSSRATLELGESGRYVLNMDSHCMSPQALTLIGGPGPHSAGPREGNRSAHKPEGSKFRGDGPRADSHREDAPRWHADGATWRRHLPVFGFDGQSHWVIGPDGRTRQRASSAAPDADSRSDDDDDPDLLMLGPILERLERGYEVQLVPPGDGSTPGTIVVEAVARGAAPSRRMPSRVRVVADSKSYEIRSLDARWEGSVQASQLRRLEIELLGPSQRGAEYFSSEAHEPSGEAETTDAGTL